MDPWSLGSGAAGGKQGIHVVQATERRERTNENLRTMYPIRLKKKKKKGKNSWISYKEIKRRRRRRKRRNRRWRRNRNRTTWYIFNNIKKSGKVTYPCVVSKWKRETRTHSLRLKKHLSPLHGSKITFWLQGIHRAPRDFCVLFIHCSVIRNVHNSVWSNYFAPVWIDKKGERQI